MGFHLLIGFVCVFATWAVLSMLGSERQRRLDVLETERKSAEAKAEYERAAAAAMQRMVPIAPAARKSER